MGLFRTSILLLFFSLNFTSFAQVTTESRQIGRQLKQELEFNVEFASLILRVGEEIDKEIAKGKPQARVEDFLEMENRQIEVLLKEKIIDFAEFYEKKITLPDEKKSLFRRHFPLMNWANIADALKASMIGTQGFFKRRGIGIAIGIGLGVVLEYSSYFLLYQSGLTHLIPIAMAIPYGTILSAGPKLVSYLNMRKRLKEVLGGSKALKAYRLQKKSALKRIKMKSPDDILFPLNLPDIGPQNKITTLILGKNNWWHTILLKLGLNPKKLSYPTLKVFLIVNNIGDDFIRWVQAHPGLPLYMKTALISEHIISTSDDNIRTKFTTSFSSSITEVRRAPYWNALKGWTNKIMNAKNVAAIRESMAQIPPGVPPIHIIELWEKVILPHYSTQMDLSYGSYRRLKDELTLLNASISKKPKANWNEEFYKEFEEKMVRSLRLNLPTCENPEQKVLFYLLRNAV